MTNAKFDFQLFLIKLTSRKLWVAICGFITLLLTAKGLPEESVAQYVALIMAGASISAYIFGEAWIDSKEGTINVITNTVPTDGQQVVE